MTLEDFIEQVNKIYNFIKLIEYDSCKVKNIIGDICLSHIFYIFAL